MSILDVIKFLIIISVLPSIVLMFVVYKKDKIEKEPLGLLTLLFFLGGISIIPAAFGETIISNFVEDFINLEKSWLGKLIDAFFIVALIEEGLKFIILKLGTWKKKEFNYSFDAIVYAVFVSLGFAAFENILYVFGNGIITAIIRAIVSIPGHMTFGVLMGIYYGRAKVCELRGNITGKNTNLMLSLITPIIFHGLFDYCLFMKSGTFLIIFLVLLICIYIILFRSISKYSREDVKIQTENVNFDGDFIDGFTDDFTDASDFSETFTDDF